MPEKEDSGWQGSIDWDKVYGSAAEVTARVWDGRGLLMADAEAAGSPEPELEAE